MREVLRVIENGRDLIEVKEALGHGNFMAWAKQAFPMYRHETLTRWMNATEMYGDKIDLRSNLGNKVMQLLAAPSMPDEVREEIEARALAGEKITVAEVQAVLEVLALGPASKREVADALGVRLDVVGRCIHELDLGKDSVRILTHR